MLCGHVHDEAGMSALVAGASGAFCRRFTSTLFDPLVSCPAAASREGSLVERIVTDPPPDRETLCADWQAEVEDTVALLRLRSVLGGGTARALVNIEGVLLAVGDTFDIARTDLEFSVVSTARRSVVLGCYNVELDCWHEASMVMGSGE